MSGEDDIDIDIEALQAQVNISLSSLEQMVSSWMKPAVKATPPKSSGLTDRELDKIMCQPPRLGVGAPIPAASGLACDNERLRGRLLQKSGAKGGSRGQDQDARIQQYSDDDEQESRASAIRRRAVVDPFAAKKKGVLAHRLFTPQPTLQMPLELQRRPANTVEVWLDGNGDGQIDSTDPLPVGKKKRRKKDLTPISRNTKPSMLQPMPSPYQSFCGDAVSPQPLEARSPCKARIRQTLLDSASDSSHSASQAVRSETMSGTSSSSVPQRESILPNCTMKRPELNVDGPSELNDTDYTRKIGRKRRKKRHPFLNMAGTRDITA